MSGQVVGAPTDEVVAVVQGPLDDEPVEGRAPPRRGAGPSPLLLPQRCRSTWRLAHQRERGSGGSVQFELSGFGTTEKGVPLIQGEDQDGVVWVHGVAESHDLGQVGRDLDAVAPVAAAVSAGAPPGAGQVIVPQPLVRSVLSKPLVCPVAPSVAPRGTRKAPTGRG